jgi:hypothetical protein
MQGIFPHARTVDLAPTVYIDLDECLIHSKPYEWEGWKYYVTCGDEVYFFKIRPYAHDVLKLLRAEGRTVKMLTSSVSEYAYKINSRARLGFYLKDIIAREDYFNFTQVGYSDLPVLLDRNHDTSGHLIDNLSISSDSSILKRGYLGIPMENYHQVSEYTGNDENDNFLPEIEHILKTIV